MQVRGASGKEDRLRSAAFGFGVTLGAVAAIACAQFLAAPYTVAFVGGMDPAIDAWAVTSFRKVLAEGYSVVGLLIALYWLLSGALGRERLLEIRSANVTLALSGLTFASAMAIASTVPSPGRLFRAACPLLGIDNYMPSFGFDLRTPCEAFAAAALPLLQLGLPSILLLASAILRIVGSRHGVTTEVR
jgi:hypothetical protein